jgi:hypothetical protein
MAVLSVDYWVLRTVVAKEHWMVGWSVGYLENLRES